MSNTSKNGVLSKQVPYGTSVNVGYLPANACITEIGVNVTAAFNNGGTNTIDIPETITGLQIKYTNDCDGEAYRLRREKAKRDG